LRGGEAEGAFLLCGGGGERGGEAKGVFLSIAREGGI